MRKDSIAIVLGIPHRLREAGKQSPDGFYYINIAEQSGLRGACLLGTARYGDMRDRWAPLVTVPPRMQMRSGARSSAYSQRHSHSNQHGARKAKEERRAKDEKE